MKILIYICLLISFSIATDHSPRNISPSLELIGETTYCLQTKDYYNEKRWVCVDFMSEKYCDVPKYYYVDYSEEYGWEFSYHIRFQNCKINDVYEYNTTTFWEYRISNDDVITEYIWHYDGEDKIVDKWRKGKLDKNIINRQILSLQSFTQNVYYKGKSHL